MEVYSMFPRASSNQVHLDDILEDHQDGKHASTSAIREHDVHNTGRVLCDVPSPRVFQDTSWPSSAQQASNRNPPPVPTPWISEMGSDDAVIDVAEAMLEADKENRPPSNVVIAPTPVDEVEAAANAESSTPVFGGAEGFTGNPRSAIFQHSGDEHENLQEGGCVQQLHDDFGALAESWQGANMEGAQGCWSPSRTNARMLEFVTPFATSSDEFVTPHTGGTQAPRRLPSNGENVAYRGFSQQSSCSDAFHSCIPVDSSIPPTLRYTPSNNAFETPLSYAHEELSPTARADPSDENVAASSDAGGNKRFHSPNNQVSKLRKTGEDEPGSVLHRVLERRFSCSVPGPTDVQSVIVMIEAKFVPSLLTKLDDIKDYLERTMESDVTINMQHGETMSPSVSRQRRVTFKGKGLTQVACIDSILRFIPMRAIDSEASAKEKEVVIFTVSPKDSDAIQAYGISEVTRELETFLQNKGHFMATRFMTIRAVATEVRILGIPERWSHNVLEFFLPKVMYLKMDDTVLKDANIALEYFGEQEEQKDYEIASMKVHQGDVDNLSAGLEHLQQETNTRLAIDQHTADEGYSILQIKGKTREVCQSAQESVRSFLGDTESGPEHRREMELLGRALRYYY